MKKCFSYFSFLIVILFSFSCSNDLEVLAPYEENALIYGLLNPFSDTQFVKINKVFTNPNQKAKDVAQISDSLYFDSINPVIIEEQTGRIIPLYRANVLFKQSGIFANSPNYLYATTEKIFPRIGTQNATYRLEVKLPKSGKTVSSVTNIPDYFISVAPVNPSILPKQISFPDSSSGFTNTRIQFTSPLKSKVFDGIFYFNYLEVNKSDTNIKIKKTLAIHLFDGYRSTSDKRQENFNINYRGIYFYNNVLLRLKIDPNIERRFLPCEFAIFAGNLELDNYMQASKPSIGIVQKQTDYSNIINGIGLFGAVNTSKINNIELTPNSKLTFLNYKSLKPLGFTLN